MIALISGAMNSIEPKRFMISVKKESESKIIYLLLKINGTPTQMH